MPQVSHAFSIQTFRHSAVSPWLTLCPLCFIYIDGIKCDMLPCCINPEVP